jgi:hypothetical protein
LLVERLLLPLYVGDLEVNRFTLCSEIHTNSLGSYVPARLDKGRRWLLTLPWQHVDDRLLLLLALLLLSLSTTFSIQLSYSHKINLDDILLAVMLLTLYLVEHNHFVAGCI